MHPLPDPLGLAGVAPAAIGSTLHFAGSGGSQQASGSALHSSGRIIGQLPGCRARCPQRMRSLDARSSRQLLGPGRSSSRFVRSQQVHEVEDEEAVLWSTSVERDAWPAWRQEQHGSLLQTWASTSWQTEPARPSSSFSCSC